MFDEELKRLADTGYPELQEEARKRLALNQYLTGLENPQVAFSVRQNKPETVDDAVRITLEMECYLQASKPTIKVASVVDKEDEDEPGAIVNTTRTKPNDPLQLLLDRMDKLEKAVQQKPPEPDSRANARWRPSRSIPPSGPHFRRTPRICWNCRGEGQISSNCPSPRREKQEIQTQPPPMQQLEQQRPGNELGAVSQAPEGNPEARTLGNDTGNGHCNENEHTSITVVNVPLDSYCILEGQVNEVFLLILGQQRLFCLGSCGKKLVARNPWPAQTAGNWWEWKALH